jgi:N-hydroxyarylamine O-acetyltransferase
LSRASSHVRQDRRLDVKAYLDRIHYDGPLNLDAETLRQLHIAHLWAVPFENLSIHHGQPIVLEDSALFNKIVERRRGGFCYELNGLFAALLRSVGFDVSMLSASVANATGEYGPDFDHMALLVNQNQRWLADVGFGDSFLEPLSLDDDSEQVQGERVYRIVADGEYSILEQRETFGPWRPQYRFTLRSHAYPDFAEMCRYHQTSPQSHFTQNRVCTRATAVGRITLSEMRLITTVRGTRRKERILETDEEYAKALDEYFGIKL